MTNYSQNNYYIYSDLFLYYNIPSKIFDIIILNVTYCDFTGYLKGKYNLTKK